MKEKLAGKNVVIMVAQEFEDIELLYPVLELSEAGIQVIVVPVPSGLHPRPFFDNKPVTGRFGHTVPIPVMEEGRRYKVGRLEELSADKIDCLLFPGGYSPDNLRIMPEVLALVRACYQKGKLVTAICHGPWVLISAGLLRGKRATGYAAVHDDLRNAGAEFVDAAVVRDGNLITSRTPDDLPPFCREIIAALGE
jgi:protease I